MAKRLTKTFVVRFDSEDGNVCYLGRRGLVFDKQSATLYSFSRAEQICDKKNAECSELLYSIDSY